MPFMAASTSAAAASSSSHCRVSRSESASTAQDRDAPPACMVAVGTNRPGMTWLNVMDRICGSTRGASEATDTHEEEPR